MTIIDIYIYIYIYINSSTTTLFQLNKSCNYTYSSKGENTLYYDKHHIQHPSIIHTSTFNHIKLFIKDLQGNRA